MHPPVASQEDEDLRSWLNSNDVTGLLLLQDDGSGLADPDPDGRVLRHVSDLVSGKHYYAVPLDDGRGYSHSYEPRKLGTNVGDGECWLAILLEWKSVL